MVGILGAETEKEKNILREKLMQADGFPPITAAFDEPRYEWDFGNTTLRLYDANHSCVMVGTIEDENGHEVDCGRTYPTYSLSKEIIEAHALKSILHFDESRWQNDEYLAAYFRKVETFFPDYTSAHRFIQNKSNELASDYVEFYRENSQ